MVTMSILRSNNGKCPSWDVDVSVRGWYKEAADGSWQFLRAECPIIENSKLPRHEQQQIYECMYCKDPSRCSLYQEFQPRIVKDI